MLFSFGCSVGLSGSGSAVLLIKDALQFCLCACGGVALQKGGQVGSQLVGIVENVVKVIAVLVVARIGAFDVVYLALQRSFLSGITVFHRHKVAVLRSIGRTQHPVYGAGENRGTGRQAGEDHHRQQQRGNGDYHAYRVPRHKGNGFFRFLYGLFRRLAGVLRCLCRRSRAALFHGLCILPLDTLLLHEAGSLILHRLTDILMKYIVNSYIH